MIEHPDHTGASSNPLAPWNAHETDADDFQCDECGATPDDAVDDGEACEEDGCEGAYRLVDHEPDWDSMPGGHDDRD